MCVEPDRVVLLEHVAQVVGNPLRAYDGSTGADADNLHMGDGPQPLDDVLQLCVADHQGVTSGEKHVADYGSLLDVLYALLYPVVGRLSFCPAKRRRVQ